MALGSLQEPPELSQVPPSQLDSSVGINSPVVIWVQKWLYKETAAAKAAWCIVSQSVSEDALLWWEPKLLVPSESAVIIPYREPRCNRILQFSSIQFFRYIREPLGISRTGSTQDTPVFFPKIH